MDVNVKPEVCFCGVFKAVSLYYSIVFTIIHHLIGQWVETVNQLSVLIRKSFTDGEILSLNPIWTIQSFSVGKQKCCSQRVSLWRANDGLNANANARFTQYYCENLQKRVFHWVLFSSAENPLQLVSFLKTVFEPVF